MMNTDDKFIVSFVKYLKKISLKCSINSYVNYLKNVYSYSIPRCYRINKYMYDQKYNINNIIHPKIKHNKTIGYFAYLG